jgi:hypothetical protein
MCYAYMQLFSIIGIMCGAGDLIIAIMCGAGDAVKLVTFVLNCQLSRTKIQPFTQHSLPHTSASNTKNEIVAHTTDHGDIHLGPT